MGVQSKAEIKNVDKGKVEDIKTDFYNFDRIFYWQDDKFQTNSLLLFSVKSQVFMQLDLEDKKMSVLNIKAGRAYHQVAFYDKKLFCINREEFVIDIFFSSKKQQLFHKRTIYFGNKDLKLKEEFSLTVWEHHEKGILYRCLLGPLEDGRYISFDLMERYFEGKTSEKQVIATIVYISMTLKEDKHSKDVVCTMNEAKKTFLCFDNSTMDFYEYNDFCGKDSVYLNTIGKEKYMLRRVKRMYMYYPYDFFPRKVRNQLQSKAYKEANESDIETFVRDRYTEVLICMEGGPLLKMRLLDEVPLANVERLWGISAVDVKGDYNPIDIAINEHTGEIYCLYEYGIVYLEETEQRFESIPVHRTKKTGICSFDANS